VPTVPETSDEVVTAKADGATVIEADAVAVCAGLPESVAVAAKLKTPLVVGVPEIAPALERVSPAGRLPELSDQP
jgi:SpoU rRNA methylase family enzyme